MAVTHSIVIVNFNNKIALRALLKTLQIEQALLSEVVVVDSASFDGSAEMVHSEHPEVRLIRLAANRGFAAAANAGIARSVGEVVTLCHSDIVTSAHTLEDLADHLRESMSRSVAVVAARQVRPDGTELPSAGRFPGFWRGVLGAIFPSRGVAQFVPRFEHANDQEFASFACAAINPETWIALGGFDARFFLFYEDADLCQRLHEKGQRILFDRKISVVHVPTTSGGGRRLAPHLARLARKSQALFFAKHRPPWQAAVIRFIGRVFGGKET